MAELYFKKTTEDDTSIKLYFTSYLRDDFVERSIVLSIDKDLLIQHIYFSSYKHGSVEWTNGVGLHECRLWENEDQAQSPTYLTRRYTTKLSNGIQDLNYAQKNILADLFKNMADKDFSQFISSIAAKKKYSEKFNYDKFTFKKDNN